MRGAVGRRGVSSWCGRLHNVQNQNKPEPRSFHRRLAVAVRNVRMIRGVSIEIGDGDGGVEQMGPRCCGWVEMLD